MNCKQCGRELPESAEFCNQCGYSFNNPPAQTSQSKNDLSMPTQQTSQPTQSPENNISVKREINIKGMIKWGFTGLPIGFIVGFFTGYKSIAIFWITLIAFVIIFALIGAKSKTKEEEQQEATQQFQSNERLSTNEKIAAWIFCIINPVITGAIMYFMWRNKYPQKAKQANHISFTVFIIELLLGAALAMFSQ